MPEYTHPDVYFEEIPPGIPPITGVATDITAFIGEALQGPVNQPVTIENFGDFERLFGGLWLDKYLGYAVRDFFLNGGRQAIIVRLVHDLPDPATDLELPKRISGGRIGIEPAKLAAETLTLDDFIGPGREDSRQGLYALEKVDFFNLLYIPPYNDDANVDPGLMAAAAAYCEKRRAFLIIDPPSQWQIGTDSYHGIEDIGSHSKNAAVFFPRLLQSNPRLPNSLKLEPFPPGGAVAGVFARTDCERGVWKSPAGREASIRGYQSLVVKDADVANIDSLGINCLRSFRGDGVVIWGARTLAPDTEWEYWKYIPVRRLALFLEASIDRGTRWAVFEPNDEAMWAKIRSQAANFLYGLFRSGAFRGETPQETYFVSCGLGDTMTPSDIDQGFVKLDVGFAPLKPAEFVVIRINQKTGQTKP